MPKIIKLVRRARKKNSPRSFLATYDVCVVNTGQRGKRVVDKLGFINQSAAVMRLNTFRLCY